MIEIKSLVETAYQGAPVSIQNLMVSAKGWDFRLKRSRDALIRQYLNRLLASERASVEERRFQTNLVLRIHLANAVATTPYYRELAAKGDFPQIWKVEDPAQLFTEIPLLDKIRVRGNESDFYSNRFNDRNTLKGSTSGTTGSPMVTRETWESTSKRFAFVARLRSWAGLTEVVHPRRAQFTGRPICQERAPFWRRNFADNAMLFSTVHISEHSVAKYVEALERFKPELIDGYPSALLAIAQLSGMQGLQVPEPKAIIVSAETLTNEMRLRISTTFNARVFNQYAASEPSCFWSDCEFGSIHVHEEYGISEILDSQGRPVQPGQIGEVVVTSLINSAMPLIRYRTGDLARQGPDDLCECGRTLRRVAEVFGRSDDIIYTPARGYIGRLDPVFKGIEGIVEAQVIQVSLEHIKVLVVPDYERWSPKQSEKLLASLAEKVGLDPHLKIEEVEHIPRGPNGKFRAVVSLCRDRYPVDLSPY